MDGFLDQAFRGAEFVSPLGPNILALVNFSVTESLEGGFSASVTLKSSGPARIHPRAVLGQIVGIRMDTMAGDRYFTGYAMAFAWVGSDGVSQIYNLRIESWLALLERRVDCRIFQGKTAPEIIRSVVQASGFREQFDDSGLSDDYRPREYCVQYNESHSAFIRRLMEEEGITAAYMHEADKSVLTLFDWQDAHEPFAGYESLPFAIESASLHEDGEYIYEWMVHGGLTSGIVSSVDYDFTAPGKSLDCTDSQPAAHPYADFEIYRWPGGYNESVHGDRYGRVARERLQARAETFQGRSNARGLAVGHVFALTGFRDAEVNRPYLVIQATHSFQASAYRSTGGSGGERFECAFTCIDAERVVRPERGTSRPSIPGLQIARVVGAEGEEIDVDEHGRVLLRFLWDRHGPGLSGDAGDRGREERPENSSVRVRVAQGFAGAGWGMQFIPRIGQEVLVSFLDGDPDRPVVVGALYNGDNTPPFALPDNKTQSGIRTRSTKEGGADNFNQLLFEDKKGEEYIHMVAEKDHVIDVKNDRHMNIGGNLVRTVHVDEATEIKGMRQQITAKDEVVQTTGTRWVEVGGSQFMQVGGDFSADVTGGDNGGGNLFLKAKESVTIEVGKASIQMTKDGLISIKGQQIQIDADGANVIKGQPVTLN